MTPCNSLPRPPLTFRLATLLLLLMIAPITGQTARPSQAAEAGGVLTLQPPIQNHPSDSDLMSCERSDATSGLTQNQIAPIKDLIQQLGHDSFATRSRAARQLMRIGSDNGDGQAFQRNKVAAFTQQELRKAAASTDVEMSAAATHLAKTIFGKAVSHQLDTIRRGTGDCGTLLAVAQQAPNCGCGNQKCGKCPSMTVAMDWQRTAAHIGTDAIARHGFADLYALRPIVFSVPARDDWNRRAVELAALWTHDRRSTPITTLNQIAVLIACLNEPRQTSASLSHKIATHLATSKPCQPYACNDQKSVKITTRDTSAVLLNRLAIRWLATKASGIQMTQRIKIATALNEPHAIRLLTEQVFGQSNATPREVIAAIMACELTAAGVPTECLDRFLEDDRVATTSLVNRRAVPDSTPISHLTDTESPTNQSIMARPRRSRIVIQVRDVALAFKLRRNGIDPREAGFRYLRADPVTAYAAESLGFENDSQRIHAHASIRR